MFGVKYLENPECGEKNLKFFESRLEFLYFDMLKNEGRGSNRLGVKKSQKTQIVRSSKQTQYAEQRSCTVYAELMTSSWSFWRSNWLRYPIRDL